MPRYDRTGPFGQGPETGRGMGPCGAVENGVVYDAAPYRQGGRRRLGFSPNNDVPGQGRGSGRRRSGLQTMNGCGRAGACFGKGRGRRQRG